MTLKNHLALVSLATAVWVGFCGVEIYRYGTGVFLAALGGLNLGLSLSMLLSEVRCRRHILALDRLVEKQRNAFLSQGVCYLISPGGDSIMCLLCKKISHNPNDVAHRYCGFCHKYLDDLKATE